MMYWGLRSWLRAHCRRLLIAEFDVPDFAEQFAPARATYVSERFAQGVAEYADDGGLVAQGFLNGSANFQSKFVEELNRVILRNTVPNDVIPSQ